VSYLVFEKPALIGRHCFRSVLDVVDTEQVGEHTLRDGCLLISAHVLQAYDRKIVGATIV